MIRFFLGLIVLLPMGTLAIGQTPGLVQVEERCRQRMQALSHYLNEIANSSTPDVDRQQAIEQTLGMFLKGSTIQVSSLKNPKKVKTYSLNEYLQNLSLLGYQQVGVLFSNLSVRPGTNSPTDSTQVFVGAFRQGFVGRKGKQTYSDSTPKVVEFVIKQVDDPFTKTRDSLLLIKNIRIAN